MFYKSILGSEVSAGRIFPAVDNANESSCSSSCFPCVGVRLIYWSLRSTATFVISFHWSLLLAFSLHFSSSFAFLKSLFTQSSHLSCGLPHFLEPSCLFVSALFGSLSSFIRTMCPAHFIRLLTILPTEIGKGNPHI